MVNEDRYRSLYVSIFSQATCRSVEFQVSYWSGVCTGESQLEMTLRLSVLLYLGECLYLVLPEWHKLTSYDLSRWSIRDSRPVFCF